MSGLTRSLADLLFPRRCLGCNQIGSFFCPTCQASLLNLSGAICPGCRMLVDAEAPMCRCARHPLRYIRAAAEYGGPLRKAIHRFKYDGQHAAAPDLGAILAAAVAPFAMLDPLIVPVPLHARRRRQRGYNQSALLAHVVAARMGLRIEEGALLRVKATLPQVGLSAAQRAHNLTGAFSAPVSLPANTTILLVDDVCTTGATLRAAATALRQGGAGHVYGAVLAVALSGRDT